MGGQALKNTYTRRYSADEYGRMVFEITKRLSSLKIKSAVPKSYGSKDSFGDLDVLILAESLNGKDIRRIIEDYFKPNEIYHNSHVYSFDYKEFQIDFILVKTKYWNTSYHYYSYNDLGNLIGRISYKMGFRYGHYGLKLVYRHDDGGKKFEKIISQDIYKILDFLGFDAERYNRGFKELTDVFDYVIDSKYFDPILFAYESLNHQNRTRNKKRKNYAEFLNYIEGIKSKNKAALWGDKDLYVKMAEEYFGIELASQIEVWNEEVKLDKIVSEKFNGYVIMERYPDLKGKELGDSIRKFKDYVKSYLGAKAAQRKDYTDIKTLYRNWIVENDIEHIFSLYKTANNFN